MADVSINMLPVSDGLTDDGLLVVYQESAARSIRGALVKEYAREAAAGSVSAAGSAAAQAAKSAQEAKDSADRAQAAVVNAPKIVGTTWWVYDKTAGKYVDTGVEAQGPEGKQGVPGPEGKQGVPGPAGDSGVYIGVDRPTDPNVGVWINPNGDTNIRVPVVGVDYFTPEDKAQIVREVITALPVYDGEVVTE